MIEQGGSSLYTSLSLKVSSPEVLRIVASIGGTEVNHFAVWHDKAGNAVAQPLAGVTDPETGVHFPDLNARDSELFQTNLIMPEPCEFLRPNLPRLLGDPAQPRHERGCPARGGSAYRRPAVPGPVAGLLPHTDAAGESRGRRAPDGRLNRRAGGLAPPARSVTASARSPRTSQGARCG